jgi:hypothetical protein
MARPRQKNLAMQGFSVSDIPVACVLKISAKKFAGPSEGATEGKGESVIPTGIPPRPSDF